MNRESNNSSNNGIPVELMLHNSWLKIRNNDQLHAMDTWSCPQVSVYVMLSLLPLIIDMC